LIIPDFGLICSNGTLSGVCVGAFGAEEEIKIALEGDGDGIDTAGAENLEVGTVVGPETDVIDVGVGAAVLDDEVGYAFDGKGTYLADVGGELEGAGGDGLIEFEGFVDKLERGNQHSIKGSRFVVQIKWR
jgi:hypothetical protein